MVPFRGERLISQSSALLTWFPPAESGVRYLRRARTCGTGKARPDRAVCRLAVVEATPTRTALCGCSQLSPGTPIRERGPCVRIGNRASVRRTGRSWRSFRCRCRRWRWKAGTRYERRQQSAPAVAAHRRSVRRSSATREPRARARRRRGNRNECAAFSSARLPTP